jgi:hypothetical protein
VGTTGLAPWLDLESDKAVPESRWTRSSASLSRY